MQRILVGANVICYVNGSLYGNVISFKWDASTPSRVIGGIDNVEAMELAPTNSLCGWNMSLYRIKGSGGLQGLGISPVSTEIARGKYFTITLIERISDTVIFEAKFCKVDNESWDVAAKSMSIGTVAAKCLSWSNEVRPQKA